MVAKTWATTEQTEWFESRKGTFREAQKVGKVDQYVTEACSEFFEKWPEVEKLFGPAATVSTLNEEQRVQYTKALRVRKHVGIPPTLPL